MNENKNKITKSSENENKSRKNHSLRLSSSTPLQALGAKAARAAVIAHAEQSAKKEAIRDDDKKRRNRRPLTEIERELRSIRRAFESADLNNTEVRLEKPNWFSSAACTISTYDLEACAAYRLAVKEWEMAGRWGKKPPEPGPKRTYVFYASVTDPQRLGSVSIYGAGVDNDYESIRRRGRIFGLPFRSISIELGRRPFLDIVFRA